MKLTKEKILIIVACVLIIGIFFINIAINNKNEDKLLTGKHYVEISVKDYGNITLELDADTAPITVTNFINLVKDKFYDGLTFHRIMDGYMIQGGSPEHNENSGSGKTIKGEFSLNGVENNISHLRGVISMARNPYDYDSASSQFFIMQADNLYLDGSYAAFGYVISGMDVVDKIAKDAKPTDDNGTIPFEKQPVIEYIKVINIIKNNNNVDE